MEKKIHTILLPIIRLIKQFLSIYHAKRLIKIFTVIYQSVTDSNDNAGRI